MFLSDVNFIYNFVLGAQMGYLIFGVRDTIILILISICFREPDASVNCLYRN